MACAALARRLGGALPWGLAGAPLCGGLAVAARGAGGACALRWAPWGGAASPWPSPVPAPALRRACWARGFAATATGAESVGGEVRAAAPRPAREDARPRPPGWS